MITLNNIYEIPILYLVFNRLCETKKSFERIKELKPKYLFIAADGPRENNKFDSVECEKVRKFILHNINWECEVKILFRDDNLGCGTAVQEALNWFFESVEMGVIIEDDIVASEAFFHYARTMLYKFKHNTDIFSINGCNIGYVDQYYDFGATKYFNMWGWATWRRSNDLVRQIWPTYDSQIDFKKNSLLLKNLRLPTIYPHGEWIDKWNVLFDITKDKKIDTWDYQWVYTCLKQQLICIRPNKTWIVNIGFNERSTHTNTEPHKVLKDRDISSYLKIDRELHGTLELNQKYELVNVALYWQGIKVNLFSTLLKMKKKIIRFTTNVKS